MIKLCKIMDRKNPTVPEDLEIQDIEGVGPTTAKKLKEAGIVSVMDLAVTSAEELLLILIHLRKLLLRL